MAYDLGDVVGLSVQTRDDADVLANAGAVVLTVTLPDLTTATPVIANPSTGVYTADYTPTLPGLHRVKWDATGSNASSYATTFYVWDSTPFYIVSPEEARAHLNMGNAATASDRARDEELRTFIEAAGGVVEYFCGPVWSREETRTVQGGACELVLPHNQVTELTSLTPILTASAAVDVSALHVDPETGIVRHTGGLAISSGPLTAVYTVGRQTIPAALRTAALEIIKHLWGTQRGPGRPSVLGVQTTSNEDVTFLPVQGFAIPNLAMDLMKLHPAPAGVA